MKRKGYLPAKKRSDISVGEAVRIIRELYDEWFPQLQDSSLRRPLPIGQIQCA